MNLLATIRRRKKAWIPRLGAPIVAVWLAMAWQPCVMAMDAEMGHENHCEHCPPPEIEHCDDVVRHECTGEDRFSADLRATKAKSADDAKQVPVSLTVSTQPLRLQAFRAQACLANPATAPPGRSLPVLFCSWLN